MSNILFISPNPIWGGAATANMAIARMFKDNGYCVIVNDEYLNANEYFGLPIDHTPIHQKKFSDRSLLQKLVTDNKIDCIIWSPLAAVYYYVEIMRLRKIGIRQIAIVHSLSLTKNVKGHLMDYLVSLTLAQMSTIVFVSYYTMNSWNKFRAVRNSKAQKQVIHNIVNSVSFVQTTKSQRTSIGFVGRLSPEKQPDIFCDLSNFSKERFCVYGDGPLLNDLKNQYKRVYFKGLCNDLNQIYSDIGILVMTSEFENCPMVILEAQAFGIPCVAPNVGGISEIVKNGATGILYDSYTPDSILKAIEEIKSNYKYYSENCLGSSKKHIPSAAIAEWERIVN